MERFRFNRSEIGVGLLLCASLLSSAFLAWKEIQAYRASPRVDAITAYVNRFQTMKAILPPHDRVGYVTRHPRYSEPWFRGFFLAQYALSPVGVTDEISCGLIVGNFDPPLPSPGELQELPLALLRDFGQGVLLFRREANL